jgi:branched-chain amino acid transport system substrate-binding protein
LLAAILATSAAVAGAQGERVSDGVVKIGLLLDLSSLYADIGGKGTIQAVQMAIEDFGGKVLGKPIELVYAEHQNKADISALKAREWFDTQKVDMIGDVSGSAAALSALGVAKEKNKIILLSGPGASRITNEACAPLAVHYSWDTYALAAGTGRGALKNNGDTWYFLTADYAFGHSLESDASEVVKAAGGRVLGSVRHPLNTSDFSSFMLQAQTSKAKVVALANASGDTINAIKAANEFGITKNQKLAALVMFIQDVHSLGLPAAKGMLLTESFYWDLNDETRTWSRRFFSNIKKMPNMIHAGAYSSTLHYLRSVQAAGTDDSVAVMKNFRATPINDMFVKDGRVREDGRMLKEVYVFQVKDPSESKYPWDYYKLISVIPPDQATMPLSKSRCPLVNK